MTDTANKAFVLSVSRHGQSDPVSYAFATGANAVINDNPDRWALIVIEEFGLNGSQSVMDFIDAIQWYAFSPLSNAAPIQGLPFVDLGLYEDIQTLAKDAIRRCGCAHDVYISAFSQEVDNLIARKGNPQNTDFILKVARAQDYATAEEVAAMKQDSLASGFCVHGIDPDCCPAGCGEV